MMRLSPRTARQSGFTLIELIVSMVLIAILGGIVASFIRLPVQNYIDSRSRAQITDGADLILRRLERDLRLALPNSIRISGNSIEFLLTKAGGRYLTSADNLPGSTLDFDDASQRDFTVLSALPSGQNAIAANDYIVVYNLGPGFDSTDGSEPANAYTLGNVATVASVSGQTVTMVSNPYPAQKPSMQSPTNRFQVVSSPVTYICNPAPSGGGNLMRYWNYPITKDQNSMPGMPQQSALLSNNMTNCIFSYNKLANTRSALIGLTLTMQNPASQDGPLTLVHQIHVDNTP